MKTSQELVQNSYGTCCLSPAFFDDFYAAFLASSREIAGKFTRTDMAKQKSLLREGISFMVMFSAGKTIGKLKVESLGESHSQARMDIKPEWYDLWTNSLLKAVAKHDPGYSPEVQRAWREVLSPGIEAMRSRYAARTLVGA
jgi:hemoglobin-like flavoprotein